MIFINPSRLPSLGKFQQTFEYVEYPYLTYQDMLIFDTDIVGENNQAIRKRLEIFHLLCKKREGEPLLSYSLYDLNAILYVLKISSIPNQSEADYVFPLTCSKCNTKSEILQNLDEIIFVDPPKELMELDQVLINGKYYKVAMPTIKEFYENLRRMAERVPLKYIYMISFVKGLTIDEVYKGQAKEMRVLEYVYDLVSNNIVKVESLCPSCQGGVEIDLNNISPTFRELVISNVSLDAGKELLFKVPSDRPE